MRAKSAWTVTFVLGLALATLVVVAGIADGARRAGYFSADHLYIPTLFADLTRWKGHFSDWELTPAPYFFPDMVLYGLARGLTRSLEAAQYATCLAQLLLVITASRALLRRALPNRAGATAVIAPIFAVWLMLHSYEPFAFIGPTLEFSAHGGSLLTTLAVFALCLRPQWDMRVYGAVAVAVLSALAGASDALFVVSCSSVLGVTALCYTPAYIRARRSGIGPLPVSLARCSLGAICGVAGLWFARGYGLARPQITSGTWELAVETVTTIWNEPDPRTKWTIAGLLCSAILAVLVMIAAWRNSNCGGLRVLAFWQLAVTTSVLGAFLYTGAHQDRWTLRYLVAPCNLAVVLIAGLAALKLGAPQKSGRLNPWPTRVAVLVIGAVVVGITTQASALVRTTYAAPPRAAAACVAEVAEREGSTVLAEYWVAKPIMLFSDNRAHVVQVTPGGLKPNFWIASRGWFRPPQVYGIVITNRLDRERIVTLFGNPQRVERCNEYELWVYSDIRRVHMTFRLQYMFDVALAGFDAERKLGF